jgi:hypothetical protein
MGNVIDKGVQRIVFLGLELRIDGGVRYDKRTNTVKTRLLFFHPSVPAPPPVGRYAPL